MTLDEEDKGAVMEIIDNVMMTYTADILQIQIDEQDQTLTDDTYLAVRREKARGGNGTPLDMIKITASVMIKSYIMSKQTRQRT